MKRKIKVSQAVLVEGRYDQIKMDGLMEGLILPVHGFSIFTDRPLQQTIRKLAEKRGVIILTDSDSAGFKIRGFLAGLLPPEQVTHVYIPDIYGKESRKVAPSKEGTLGVEGMTYEILEEAFQKAGILSGSTVGKEEITAKDFYQLGLSGGKDSSQRRKQLYQQLGLPKKLSTSQGIKILNQMWSLEDLTQWIKNQQ